LGFVVFFAHCQEARAHHPKNQERLHSKDLQGSKKVEHERLDLEVADHQWVSWTLKPAQSDNLKLPDHGLQRAKAGIP
jgi:hypothetical protein